MAGKDNGVNPEARADLAEFKTDINNTITTLIKAGFREIQERMTELFNKDIDHIKETQDRHNSHHENHYSEISKIKDMLIEHRACDKTKDKLDEINDRKKGISASKVAIIVSACSLLSGLIVYFIK